MADKNFKIKTGLTLPQPLPADQGGTGQSTLNNALNSMLPSQVGNTGKVLASDGTSTTWATLPTGYTKGSTASRPASPSAGDLYFNTDYSYFESYTINGWFPIAAAPGIPTGVTATNQPSSRAFNNGQMSVAFTPSANGGAPTTFVLTPSPSTSPSTFSGSTSPITVTGLSSSTQYTYTISATSPYGTSSASSASTAVTATTVPQAPSLVATGGSTNVSIAITAGSTGGSEITGYTIISNPATTTQTTSSSPYTFTGLTEGTSYTFTATATNANGTSAASSASNSVSTSPPSYTVLNGYVALASHTFANSSTNTITFATIPTSYKHLILVTQLQGTQNSGTRLYFNNDTTNGNYAGAGGYTAAGATGSAVTVSNATSSQGITDLVKLTSQSDSATGSGFGVIEINDSSSTSKLKVVRATQGTLTPATNGELGFLYGAWTGSTAAISAITLTATTGNYNTNSRIDLYGIN